MELLIPKHALPDFAVLVRVETEQDTLYANWNGKEYTKAVHWNHFLHRGGTITENLSSEMERWLKKGRQYIYDLSTGEQIFRQYEDESSMLNVSLQDLKRRLL
jgi:hypothetical protein